MKATLNALAGAGLPALGVKRPWLVTVMNLLIAIAGLVAIFAIEVRELPDVDEPVVNVRANLPGASPETMDAEVTRILEGAVARVSGVKEVNSNSEEGNTRIRAVFNSSSDVDRAAADVREAVSRVQRQLPDNVEQLAVFKADEDAEEIMRIALAQARDGRNFILGEMNKVISEPRAEMSEFAPRLMTMKVHPDKIRDVIGKGGVTIRAITEETGCTIDIADDGTVTIASVNKDAAEEARRRIEQITADVEPGQIFEGKVIKIMNFGAFVSLTPGRDGLVHISQISNERVEKVSDKLAEGDVVKVKVLEVDRQGRVRLSMKEVDAA